MTDGTDVTLGEAMPNLIDALEQATNAAAEQVTVAAADLNTLLTFTELLATKSISTPSLTMTAKLWIGTALTPYGNEYGLVAVVAETREEAIAKAKLSLDDPGNYVPNQRYAGGLLDNLDAMSEIADEVFIDWDAAHR
jgi:hypothetical protein